jgi:hypothetical protein
MSTIAADKDEFIQTGTATPATSKRSWLTLEIHPVPGAVNTFQVALVAELDIRVDSEREVGKLLCDHKLDIRYNVNIDFADAANGLVATLDGLFAQDGPGKTLKTEVNALSDAQIRKFLSPLAAHGKILFDKLFSKMSSLSVHPDWTEPVKNAVRSILGRASQTIMISCPEPLFPWAFLYDHDYDELDETSVKPEGFWGFKHCIELALEQSQRKKRLRLKEILSAVSPELADDGLHQAIDHPFTKLGQTVKTVGNVWDLRDELNDLKQDCFYFYGHAGKSGGIHPSCWLQLNKIFLHLGLPHPTSKRSLPFINPALELVVIFLNGCDTSPATALSDETALGYLWNHSDERVCCVASVGGVPQKFGARFARHFWKEFLFAQKPIGDALLSARLEQLQSHNPLGLLYTLLGKIDTQVVGKLQFPEEPIS